MTSDPQALADPVRAEAEKHGLLPIWQKGWIAVRLSAAMHAYLAEYVFSPDEGCDHEPTEFERMILDDMLNGALSSQAVNDILQEAAAALLRASTPAPSSPETAGEGGWKLVPVEPTEAMWQAGRDADVHPGDSYSAVYAAMLAASPPPPPAPEPAPRESGQADAGVREACADMIYNAMGYERTQWTATNPPSGAWKVACDTASAIAALATPAPSVGTGEAVAKIMQYIEDIMIEAEVDYPAGREAGSRISYDSNAIEKYVTDTLAALAPPLPAAAVDGGRVKALEWVEANRSCQKAVTPFGAIRAYSHGGWHAPWTDGDQSSEDAKVAAQADYEARIRAALTASPAGEE